MSYYTVYLLSLLFNPAFNDNVLYQCPTSNIELPYFLISAACLACVIQILFHKQDVNHNGDVFSICVLIPLKGCQ